MSPIVALVQAIIERPDFWNNALVVGGISTLGGGVLYVIRTLIRVEGLLIGADGNNGVRGKVNDIADRLEVVIQRLTAMEGRVGVNEVHIQAVRDDVDELCDDFKAHVQNRGAPPERPVLDRRHAARQRGKS